MRALRTLYAMLSPRRRGQLLTTFVLMLVGAAAEIVTIGAVVPFLALAMGADAPFMPDALQFWSRLVGGTPVAGAALLLAAAAVAAAGIRLLLAAAVHNAVLGLGHDIAGAVFSRALRQPYAVHVRQNSSTTISAVEQVQRIVMGVLLPALQGLVAAILAVCVLLLLLAIDPRAASIAAVFAGVSYVAVSLATAGRLDRNSKALADSASARMRSVQEGLGGIRDIILDRAQPAVEARFRAVDSRYREAQAMNAFIASTPRYVVEAAGVVAMVAVVLVASTGSGSIAAAVPVLGALALGAQRLLPLLQTIWLGWSSVRGNRTTFERIVHLMEMPVAPESEPVAPGTAPILSESLEFDDVSYQHPGGHAALRGASFRIAAGDHVGIVGLTGAGKSTLLDLMMGLIEADTGEIRIDGRPLTPSLTAAWQAQVAHVPQTPYLFDESIRANISFPRDPDEVDPTLLEEALRTLRLEPFLATLPDGLETRVGERGVRLSAGQRQRVGLARAMVRRPRLLILDEATSALDGETEEAVLAAIHTLPDVTLVIVAHRTSSLARCRRIVEVAGGAVRER
jgi:ATP-binding cassette subfamily B protein